MAGLTDISLGNFTKFHITTEGGTDYDLPVANLQAVGDLGDEATIVDVSEYGVKYLRKLVGSASAGPVDLTVNFDPSDTSFTRLEALYKSGLPVACKLEMLDSSETNGSFVTFTGLVASKSFGNEFDGVRSVVFSIAIDGAVSDVTANA